ncbi:MAG: hypothetical protein AAFQ94_16795 [Bacteroidota bacterium]
MEEKDTKYFYDQAKYLVNVRKKSPQEAVDDLVADGLDQDSAVKMVNYASGFGADDGDDNSYADTGSGESGVKDMVIGGLFCVGGIIATAAEIGYIFWGAIVFGGIQFIRGLSKSLS